MLVYVSSRFRCNGKQNDDMSVTTSDNITDDVIQRIKILVATYRRVRGIPAVTSRAIEITMN